jgi:hypothetical protein
MNQAPQRSSPTQYRGAQNLNHEWEGIRELQEEVHRLRRANARSRGRFRLRLLLATIAIAVAAAVSSLSGQSDAHSTPSAASLAGMSLRQRIVALANSQVGYGTDPERSYCNKFSAYWNAGTAGCPGSEMSEQWCADFAAWAWRKAGVRFTYGDEPGQLNARAASFYTWGVTHHEWHPAGSGYVVAPVRSFALRRG